jgi:hypothetical protein
MLFIDGHSPELLVRSFRLAASQYQSETGFLSHESIEDNAILDFMPAASGVQGIYDNGFFNTGVRPTAEDIGRGGDAPFLNPLTNLPTLIAGLPDQGMVFVSSGYLGKKTATIAETVRDRVYITYPYRLTPYVGSKSGGFDAKVPILTSARDFGDRRIKSRTTTMLQQATLQGLNLLYDNLYRDHLFDTMSMQMDLTVRDYERFSFGPGQRYVSKGCYIIQLGPGADPALLPRSEWVMH